MISKILLPMISIIIGFLLGVLFVFYFPITPLERKLIKEALPETILPQKEVVGFLPYWLISKATQDYSPSITTLTYFGLTVDRDGTILKDMNKKEKEPGWYALTSGKIDPFLNRAKENKQKLSLLVFNGDVDEINELISDPIPHAQNLVRDVAPIMRQYGFTDLNLDIENVDDASEEARANFTEFAREVKRGIDSQKLGTITLDITASSSVKKNLIDPKQIKDIADYVVIMGYDFHYVGSLVTGPVAPVSGAPKTAEFDMLVAIQEALKVLPANKIILGIPSYGYEWETIRDFPRAAVIPSSGVVASSRRVDELLSTCSNCTIQVDNDAQENYIIYKDEKTGTYHQIFYPAALSTQAKIDLVRSNNLEGLAIWALGYEDANVMKPLVEYLRSVY